MRCWDRFWETLWPGIAQVECVREADLQSARSISRGFADQDFSITDCTSFAVMTRFGITRAASFDAHFAVFRYGPRRNRAFEVVG